MESCIVRNETAIVRNQVSEGDNVKMLRLTVLRFIALRLQKFTGEFEAQECQRKAKYTTPKYPSLA